MTDPELREAVDAHPEDTCGDCAGVNPVWFAPSPLWNLVMGGPAALGDPGGIICPNCFIRRAEAAGVVPTAWVVSEEPVARQQQEEVEGLRAAINWIEPPFVDENTPVDELRLRIKFAVQDAAAMQSKLGGE